MHPNMLKLNKAQLMLYEKTIVNLKKRFILKSIDEFEYNQELVRLSNLVKEYKNGISLLEKEKEPEFVNLHDLDNDEFINTFY